MNRSIAKQIAENITNAQLQEMFNRAKVGIIDWTRVSSVNKGMSKGAAWNVLAKDFDINHSYHIMAKINMVREFGEFLPDELKPKIKKREKINIIHQNPIFD